MDVSDPVSDVRKVANRKRISDDVDKLREKVSRETSKIIKLRVAQDTAYWDLKEKLQAVEANHERLQANMVDVQMQHEAISASYEAELRRRPETLNKLAASRAIADTLEENAARLRDSLRRQAADCAALQNAYGGAAQRALLAVAGAQGAVRAQRASFEGAVERERAAADRARADAVRAAASAASHCHQAESARRDLERATTRYTLLAEEMERSKGREDNAARLLREAETERERLTVELQSSRDRLERDGVELEAVRGEVARLEAELRAEGARREADLEAERAARASAECEWRAAADRAAADWSVEREQLAAELSAARDALTRVEAKAGGERARLEAECEEGKRRAAAAEREGRAWAEAARASGEQRAAALLAELEEERERGRTAAAALAARADTISDLMRDVTREAEARATLEDSLKARDVTLRKHEADLVDRMNIINDLRAEKERLQEKINSMQVTIDNIQELARDVQRPAPEPAPAAVREPAEREVEDMLYSFLSDDSGETMSFNAGEVDRQQRFVEKTYTKAEHRSSNVNSTGTINRSGTTNRFGTINSSGTTNPTNRSDTANRYIFKNKRLVPKRK